jgi:hypothetical protein
MNRTKATLPLTRCDRPPHVARVHGTPHAYSRWGCRCTVAVQARAAWRAQWVKTPNGAASIKASNAVRRANRKPRPVSPSGLRRAERESIIITWTRRGEPARKIAAEIGRTVRQVQRLRAKLRLEGKIK